MAIIASSDRVEDETDGVYEETDGFGPDFKPLTAEQARQWRVSQPTLSPWVVVGLQVGAGALAVLCCALFWDRAAAWSAGYGALVVVVPAALFARGLGSRFSSLNAATAGWGFFVWEAVKLAVTFVLLLTAPRQVENLNWLALMAGLFVTLKVYWLALILRPKTQKILRV